jgi:hypothetical protein
MSNQRAANPFRPLQHPASPNGVVCPIDLCHDLVDGDPARQQSRLTATTQKSDGLLEFTKCLPDLHSNVLSVRLMHPVIKLGTESAMHSDIRTKLPPRNACGRTAAHGRLPALALFCALAACSNSNLEQKVIGGGTTQISGARPVGGFLPQPDLLGPGGPGKPELVYLRPGLNFQDYSAISLAPVAVVFDPSSPLASTSAAQREALANTYYSDLYQAARKHCRVTTGSRPGTMRFYFALTDAKSSDAVVKTLANYTPYVSFAYKIGSVAFNDGVGYFSGSATSEAYATDASTGALLWQGVDRRGGSTSVVQNTINDWQDVNNAFSAWSEQLVARLQQLGVCRQ